MTRTLTLCFSASELWGKKLYCVDHTAHDMLLLHTFTNTNRNLLKSLEFDSAGALSILVDGTQMNLTNLKKYYLAMTTENNEE